MKASILVSTGLAAITVAACMSGDGAGGAGTNAAGTGGVGGGVGGTSGHTITGGEGGTSGISTAGAGGGAGTQGAMSAAICPADAPRATTTALPCSSSDVPYGTQCSYAAETSGCSEAFECECVSASPGVDCFWHPLGETCANAGSGGVSGGGSGGSGGAGGAGGSGAANPCPDTPPTDGTPCTPAEAAFCTYHDCAGAGETNARCQAPVLSMWLVETRPCEAIDCHGTTCGPGQVCMETRGGPLSAECIANPCGSAPQGCDCPGVCASCTSFSGNSLVCSECPIGEECI